MFEIVKRFKTNPQYRPNAFAIRDKRTNEYLHSDGSVYDNQCAEWWPTEEQAQIVLDKYRRVEKFVRFASSYGMDTASFLAELKPVEPPAHVWVHGDVFESRNSLFILLEFDTKQRLRIFCLNGIIGNSVSSKYLDEYLEGATSLFNIKTVIKDKL